MNAVAAATPRPGEVLLGRYRIERTLGEGGMGVVVAARHLELDSLVAIKFLLPEVMQNADVVARFAREARAAARIKSEHVVRVTDVGTLPSGAPYMVMEFLEGADLAALVQARGSLPELEAVDYLLQALEAIAEAHKVGIVHRDLKPANLFLSRRADGSELIKVLDFGISKMSDTGGLGSGGKMTSTSALLGSPVYMSPEQLTSSRDVDGRTDIWSLGIILYELLSGRQPFMADTVPQLCISILQADPIPLASVRPEVAPGLQAVVDCCIEKDRVRRYATVGELAAALAPFAGSSSRLSIERILRLWPAAAGPVGVPAPRATPNAQPGAPPGTTQVLPAASATGSGSGSTTGNRAGGTVSYPGTPARTGRSTRPPGSAPNRRGVAVAGIVIGVVAIAAVLAVGLLRSPASTVPVKAEPSATPAPAVTAEQPPAAPPAPSIAVPAPSQATPSQAPPAPTAPKVPSTRSPVPAANTDETRVPKPTEAPPPAAGAEKPRKHHAAASNPARPTTTPPRPSVGAAPTTAPANVAVPEKKPRSEWETDRF